MTTPYDASSVTPDARGLRALSHPMRLRMLGILRVEGPATATTLAQRLGLNTGATSYHLRQLAAHGFIVEDDERGNARDRWWRAAHQSTRTDLRRRRTQEDHDSAEAYLQTVAIIYAEQLQAAVEEHWTLPARWQEAGTMSDWHAHLTPARAKELTERLQQVIEDFAEDPEDTEDAVPFVVNVNAYPRPGSVASEDL